MFKFKHLKFNNQHQKLNVKTLKSPWAPLNGHNRYPNLLEIAKTLVTSAWCEKWPIFASPPGHDELMSFCYCKCPWIWWFTDVNFSVYSFRVAPYLPKSEHTKEGKNICIRRHNSSIQWSKHVYHYLILLLLSGFQAYFACKNSMV